MPDRHHYVPVSLLKNFAPNQKIWLYDKHENKSFQTNIRNAFVEGDFNTVTGSGATLEAEQIFTRAEDFAAPILQKLLSERHVRSLTIEERTHLATFVAIQHLRSKQSRKNFTLIREHIQERFPSIPQSDLHIEGFSPSEVDKYSSLDFLARYLTDLTHLVAQKHLLFIEIAGPGNFWISDHPVILHNDNPAGLASNRGFGVAGIQIYLPISSSYAIAFFCPTILQELQNGITKIDGIRSNFVRQSFAEGTVGTRTNLALADLKNQQELLQSQLADLRDQQKVSFNKQDLLFLNSNQVLSAHRFVGSCENKFSLVADMLKTNPEIRSPSHISFG